MSDRKKSDERFEKNHAECCQTESEAKYLGPNVVVECCAGPASERAYSAFAPAVEAKKREILAIEEEINNLRLKQAAIPVEIDALLSRAARLREDLHNLAIDGVRPEPMAWAKNSCGGPFAMSNARA